MKMTIDNFKRRTLVCFIVCSIIIWYPFFVFKYFETHGALVITTKYFLPIILLISISAVTFFYFKRFKKLNGSYNFKSRVHEKCADFFVCTLFITIVTAIAFAVTYSTIITTNAYLGNSKNIFVSEVVHSYYTHNDKNGRLKHYIKFYSPVDKKIIDMQVYKQYKVGERFEKEMKIGQWNILYSKD